MSNGAKRMPSADPVQGLHQRWSDALAGMDDSAGPEWLRQLRLQAAGAFREGGLPHRKVEAWKYTPMRRFDAYGLAPPDDAAATHSGFDMPAPLCDRAVMVDVRDGVLQALPSELPRALSILTLEQGIVRFEPRLRALFEAIDLQGASRAFAALNTALARQGLIIHVDAGCDAGRLLLRWAFSPGAAAFMNHFRIFVLLEQGARLDLVEQFLSPRGGEGPAAAGLNVVIQAELEENAALSHTRVQAESDAAVLLTSTRSRLAAGSCYVYRGFDLGASLARHELNVRLEGAAASTDLAGAWVLDGDRHADTHACVEHVAPDCSSEQYFRGVLGGRSRGVFNGRALIQPGADGSSVRQSNANLLLSPQAEMDTKPELEIYADEVEASHGATVGQLDDTAVFYLRSRGLSEAAARRMLTAAHCRAVTDRLTGRGLAERVAELVDAAMPEGDS